MATHNKHDHFYFTEENIVRLIQELTNAITVESGGQPAQVQYSDQLVDEIVQQALLYPECLMVVDEREGAAMLRRLFVRDHLQQYTLSPSGSVFNAAGLRVDQERGRCKRHSAVGTPDEYQDQINPVLARGGDMPQYRVNQWITERTNAIRKSHNKSQGKRQ